MQISAIHLDEGHESLAKSRQESFFGHLLARLGRESMYRRKFPSMEEYFICPGVGELEEGLILAQEGGIGWANLLSFQTFNQAGEALVV